MATLDGARLELTGDVARIVLERPPYNTMTVALMRQCRVLFEDVKKTAARMVVWESAVPGMFSMGLDPHEILACDVSGRRKIFEELFALAQTVLDLPLPVAAVVRGPAMAGGAVLTGLCDEVLIERDTGKLCYSEVKVNLAVPSAITAMVARRVARATVLDMIALGRNYTADELVACGYASAVFQGDGEKEQWIKERADKWRRINRDVVGETLRGMRAEVKRGFDHFPAGVEKFLDEPYLPAGVRLVLEKMR